MYLRHGHVHVFWNALISLAERLQQQGVVEPLSDDLGHVVLVSPWVTDLPIHTSGLRSEEWAMILGASGKHIGTLSDVLQGLADLECRITLLLLDSGDQHLSMDDSLSMRKESELVRRLERSDDRIRVLKRFGLHTKAYAFPSCILEGSANLTYRGMLGNMEQLAYVERRLEPERFNSALHMVRGHLNGSEAYHARTILRLAPENELEHDAADTPEPSNTAPVPKTQQPTPRIEQQLQVPESNQKPAPAYELGELNPDGDVFLHASEEETLSRHIDAFTFQLRSIIDAYYRDFGHEVQAWTAEQKIEWMKQLKVKDRNNNTVSFYKKLFDIVERKYSKKPDHPSLAKDGWNLEDPSVNFLLVAGTTIGDLRVAIVGDVSQKNSAYMFKLVDFGKNDLFQRSLALFGASILECGHERFTDDPEFGRKFWTELFDQPFAVISDMRNQLTGHPIGPIREIWRSEAKQVDEALRKMYDEFIQPATKILRLDVEE